MCELVGKAHPLALCDEDSFVRSSKAGSPPTCREFLYKLSNKKGEISK